MQRAKGIFVFFSSAELRPSGLEQTSAGRREWGVQRRQKIKARLVGKNILLRSFPSFPCRPVNHLDQGFPKLDWERENLHHPDWQNEYKQGIRKTRRKVPWLKEFWPYDYSSMLCLAKATLIIPKTLLLLSLFQSCGPVNLKPFKKHPEHLRNRGVELTLRNQWRSLEPPTNHREHREAC